jgi:hypothetical protein
MPEVIPHEIQHRESAIARTCFNYSDCRPLWIIEKVLTALPVDINRIGSISFRGLELTIIEVNLCRHWSPRAFHAVYEHMTI